MKHRILFVCTGNICRSPMAQGLFNARAARAGEDNQFIAESAGTWALVDQPATGYAIDTMAWRGIDLSQHRGQTVDARLMESASTIIVMTRSHYEALSAEFPGLRHKLHLMSELRERTFDVADPYGGPPDEYESCANLLEDLIENGYDQIKAWALQNHSRST